MANRDWGSSTGGGGVASADAQAVARRDRLRALTRETVDLANDPYLMRNHLGSYECKLCLTLHTNDGNYLAHTHGRRHQENLRRRAASETRRPAPAPPPRPAPARTVPRVRIGRPGYRVVKQAGRSLLFRLDYPEIEAGMQPRHRFMSAFEQRRERPDGRWQYLLFAAAPYETVAFKIPNAPVDRREGRFYTHWDRERKAFTLQMFFVAKDGQDGVGAEPTEDGERK